MVERVESRNVSNGVNMGFIMESAENWTLSEGTDIAFGSELQESETSTGSIMENGSLVNMVNEITGLSANGFVENTNSSVAAIESPENDSFEKAENNRKREEEKSAVEKTNTVLYRVDERPPLVQSILLGFQVRIE